jgi:predicted Zn-dependent protease
LRYKLRVDITIEDREPKLRAWIQIETSRVKTENEDRGWGMKPRSRTENNIRKGFRIED